MIHSEVHYENGRCGKKRQVIFLFNDYVANDKQLLELLKVEKYTDEEIEYILSEDASETDKDSTYNSSVRHIFYPGSFSKEALKYIDMIRNDRTAKCPICGKYLMPEAGKPAKPLSIDHINPVVWHFNTVGYRLSQQQRREWYNDTDNLCLVHASCNSRKSGGGLKFDIAKVRIAARDFH